MGDCSDFGGPGRIRTDDLFDAASAVFQLIYGLLGGLCRAATRCVGVRQVEDGARGVAGHAGFYVEQVVG